MNSGTSSPPDAPTFTASDLEAWERRLEAHMAGLEATSRGSYDPAHDVAHLKRVASVAKRLAADEGALLEVVVPAAWLHDLVNVPKSDPRRSQASRLSGQAALELLSAWGYPAAYLEAIRHAIEAHSFSARIECRTVEARVVQDADRLEALGAIGIARVFSTAQAMGARYYDPADPFALGRPLDDRRNSLDHFYVKLFPLVETLQTDAARREGRRRAETMRAFVEELKREIGVSAS